MYARAFRRTAGVPTVAGVLVALLAAGCSAPAPSRDSAARTGSPGGTPASLVTGSPGGAPAAAVTGGAIPGAGAPTGRPARSGCGRPATAGQDRTVEVAVDPATAEGRRTRTALVHVPAGYRPGQAYPVLLVYHGHGGSSAGAAAETGFSGLADRSGFLAVYPQGLPDSTGSPMWASAGPVDYGIEELPATRGLLDTLAADYCVDPSRIYATGTSNGGGMANYLACRLSDRIAAVAPVVGNMYLPKDGGCRPARPVSILDVHAVDDPVVAYGGDRGDPSWVLPPVDDWLAGWATLDRCAARPAVAVDTPAVRVRRWSGCAPGTAVAAYRVTGGHRWPATLAGNPTAAVIWGFLAAHRLPAVAR
ncbi:alpha/beta hydrolase family esterase [Plantactinospora siamensis]|uniref:Alpha/beta hydrolase family esterase n=1 Tax=Plantactinospora siamensis TaxID=555372 RepID=A0ABV6P379_9ACTN